MKKYIVVVNDAGDVFWKNEAGELHREEGPAIETADGYRAWIIHDEYHREDGHAFEYADGYRAWYRNGKRHREDGHAVEYADGYRAWYLNDKCLTEEEFNNRNKKEITVSEIESLLGYSVKIIKG